MKKIVILQDYLRNGGTERQSIHLARALSESGCDVTLLTFRPGGALDSPDSIPEPFRRLSLQPFDTRLDFFAPRLLPTLRRIAPGIVLCMGRMANCKAGRIARAFPRIAVISTMRTGKKLPAAYIRSLHATRHTIANSHEAARILRVRHGVPADKITVIHNALLADASGTDCRPVGLENTNCLPASENPHAHQPATAVPLRLLCVAMFRPEKNHRELIELFASLPHSPAPAAVLHLVGDGPELPACRALAKKLGIADRVHFHGYISDPAPLYRHPANANTIAVLASRSESLPNFLVEAHAHGIPSVAYAAGGVAECGGIAIPPGDRPAFLAALTRIMTDATWRSAESARVETHAREHFSRQTQLQRYLELFKKMTTQGGRQNGA